MNQLVTIGLRVTIRRSKTDQEGEGQEIAIPRGMNLRSQSNWRVREEHRGIGNQ
jgi:hypothetical protein